MVNGHAAGTAAVNAHTSNAEASRLAEAALALAVKVLEQDQQQGCGV
jgi:hypothetical protein